jgi:hypothetical protein
VARPHGQAAEEAAEVAHGRAASPSIDGSDNCPEVVDTLLVNQTAAAADLNARLDRIQQLTDELARAQGDAFRLMTLCERIRNEINATRESIQPVKYPDVTHR